MPEICLEECCCCEGATSGGPSAACDLATFVLVTDLVGQLAAAGRLAGAYSLKMDLTRLDALSHATAQQAVIKMLRDPAVAGHVEEVELAPGVRLPVRGLLSGAVQRIAFPRRPPSAGALPAAPYGLVVAALVEMTRRLVEVDLRSVDLGPASSEKVAAAALGDRHRGTLRSLNGVALLPEEEAAAARELVARGLMDTGAFVVAARRVTSRLEHLDLANSHLGPEAVAAVLGALIAARPRLRRLGLARNTLGEAGTRKLAHFLRVDGDLSELSLVAAAFPQSTTPAMEALVLAMQANTTLVTADFRHARLPARVVKALVRTFHEKRPTSPMRLAAKTAFLASLQARALLGALPQDALRLVFAFSRHRRRLILADSGVEALGDLFPTHSPAARDIIDRFEAGTLDVFREDHLDEINPTFATLDMEDRRAITRAYWQLRRHLQHARDENQLARERARARRHDADDDDGEDEIVIDEAMLADFYDELIMEMDNGARNHGDEDTDLDDDDDFPEDSDDSIEED